MEGGASAGLLPHFWFGARPFLKPVIHHPPNRNDKTRVLSMACHLIVRIVHIGSHQKYLCNDSEGFSFVIFWVELNRDLFKQAGCRFHRMVLQQYRHLFQTSPWPPSQTRRPFVLHLHRPASHGRASSHNTGS